MGCSSILVNIAGVRIRIVVESPLHFKDDAIGFRGFAVPDDGMDADLNVRYVDAEGEHDESDRTQYFVGDCRGTEMPDHRWECGICADGTEYIVVDSFTNILPYKWIKLMVAGNDGVLKLVRKDTHCLDIDPFIYPLFSLMFSRLLKRRRSFLIHSSVVDDGGRGYLFTAVSGTGKSTMAKIWESQGASIVNDDMIALVCDDNSIVANNIPMPYYSATPSKVALSAIFLISQSKQNFVRPLRGAQSVLRLSANTINQPYNKLQAIEHLQFVEQVSKCVPIYELGFKPDADIVLEIRKLMS